MTSVEKIQNYRRLIESYNNDIELFEEQLDKIDDTDADLSLDDLIEELEKLSHKYSSYRSQSLNDQYAEGQESAFLEASEQLNKLIIKFKKVFNG